MHLDLFVNRTSRNFLFAKEQSTVENTFPDFIFSGDIQFISDIVSTPLNQSLGSIFPNAG